MGLFSWLGSKIYWKGKIVETVGSVKSESGGSLMNVEIKVHTLKEAGKDESREIGVEIVAKSLLSYQMMPCRLSAENGEKLRELLALALRR
jgi:hypothetical protein